ncbi:MAG TPA: glycosyltransferase family 4 protein [Nitrososphaerales archaeon]|nr:glycosyltransferase family 4 protein [Nitrososphaerales archaeon]
MTFDPPENIGGIEKRVASYALELVARGHEVSVISCSPIKHYDIGKRYGASFMEHPSSISKLPQACARAVFFMSKQNADSLVVLSGAPSALGAFVLLYAKVLQIPSLAFCYGRDILSSRKSLTERSFLGISLKAARKVAVNSEYTRGLLPRSLERKAVVIYPTVTRDENDRRNQTHSTNNLQTILFVGRLVRRKGVDLLIEAFAEIAQKHQDVGLRIVGEGPELDNLSRLAKDLGVSDKVSFTGTLREAALQSAFDDSDVLAMPSRSSSGDVEGFGTVVIEAGARGLPVVGSASGGISEAVADGVTGILVPEGDSRALAAAIRRLLDDDELRTRMGLAARERIEKEFTLDSAVDLIEESLGA